MITPRKLGLIAVGSAAAVLCLGSIVYARTGSVLPGSHSGRSAVVKVADGTSSTSAHRGDDATSSTTGASSASSEPATSSSASSASAAGSDGSVAGPATSVEAGDDGAGKSAGSATSAAKGADDATTVASASGSSATTAHAEDGATTSAATSGTTRPPATTAETNPPETTATTPAPDTTPTAPPKGESITISKCWTNATKTAPGQMLISARSSNSSATLAAYRSDGSLIGRVDNGGGGRYGGSVMPIQPYDPGTITIKSSTGASASCHTTPFENQP